MSAGRVWFDGEFRDRVVLASCDHGVLYGAGFFETFRTRNGVPVRLDAHLRRLHASCCRLGILLPDNFLSAESCLTRWTDVVSTVLADAGLVDGVLRLSVSAGDLFAGLGSGDYTRPHEWLTVRPLPPPVPDHGICLRVLDTARSSPEWRPRPKSFNYLNSLLAARELAGLREEPSEEGLMVDASGSVCEGVVSNVFWLRGGVWYTPHEDTGCLPGVGRAHAVHALRSAGFRVEETTVSIAMLAHAEAVASVGSVRGVVPVRALLRRDGTRLSVYSLSGVDALKQVFGE